MTGVVVEWILNISVILNTTSTRESSNDISREADCQMGHVSNTAVNSTPF